MSIKNTQQIDFIRSMYALFILLMLWFFFPILSIVLLCIYASFVSQSRVFAYLLISLSFGLIAYTAKSVGVEQTDLVRYAQAHQKMAFINNLNDLLVSQVLISGEINALYIIISFTLAKLFPSNPQVLLLFWVCLSYLFILLAFHEFTKINNLKRDSYFLYLLLVVIIGIPFSQTAETIKQCVSASILFYAIMLRVNNNKFGWLFAIVSVLIHMSSLMILPVFLLMNNKSIIRFWIPILLFSFALSFFNIVELLNDFIAVFMVDGIKERGAVYEEYGWELSRRYNLILFVYFIAMIIQVIVIDKISAYFKDKKELVVKIKRLVLVQFVAFIILLLNRSNVHNFVRYTICYYPFFIAAILNFDFFNLEKKEKTLLWFVFLVFFAFMNITLLGFRTDINTGYANSYLDNSIVKLLTYNVLDILKFNVNE
ncbi:MAG: EpsG family protein [Bacteroidia bacterium]